MTTAAFVFLAVFLGSIVAATWLVSGWVREAEGFLPMPDPVVDVAPAAVVVPVVELPPVVDFAEAAHRAWIAEKTTERMAARKVPVAA